MEELTAEHGWRIVMLTRLVPAFPVQPAELRLRTSPYRRTGGCTDEMLTALCLAASTATAAAQEAKVTPLVTRNKGRDGKEGTMIMVEYAPGGSDAAHRHNAYVFVYVLEGALVMQVKGGKEVTLGPGQTFYESPEDVHTVSRNASTTKPAKFLVFFVKQKGAPITVPAK